MLLWRTFPFTYEVSLSTCNGDKRKNILHLSIRNFFILFFWKSEIFFHESAIYLGYITTKLSIPKGCIKNHRLFTLDRMTFLWWWERGLDFLRSPFVLWCFQGGGREIKREFKAIRGIWLNLKFSQEETQ